MSLLPGVCFCFAPGVGEQESVLYSLYPQGFLDDAFNRRDPIFRSSSGAPLPGGGSALVPARGPVAKIEFFIEGHTIGERLSSPNDPRSVTGYMANAGYTGDASHRHRRGRGLYVVANRALLDRIAAALRVSNPVPLTEFEQRSGEALEVIDGLRGSGSDYASWATNLTHAIRGSMNLAIVAFLLFPRPDAPRRGL